MPFVVWLIFIRPLYRKNILPWVIYSGRTKLDFSSYSSHVYRVFGICAWNIYRESAGKFNRDEQAGFDSSSAMNLV